MVSYRHSARAAARCAAGLWMLAFPACAMAVDDPSLAAPVAALPAPENIVVKPISATRLGVTWVDKSSNEDHFEVEISTDGTTYTSAGRTAENTEDFTCTDLQPNTVYHVRVKATNSMGESTYVVSKEVATYSLGKGLTGHYFHRYKSDDAVKPMYTHVDPYISFEWTDGLKDDTAAAEYNFMIIWTGRITPIYSEKYTFYTESDDGARLWVDGQQLVDDWVDQSATEKSGTIDLKAGQSYDIKVGYYANDVGTSSMKLSWSSATQDKEIILQCQLDPKTAKEAEAAAFKAQAEKGLPPVKPVVKKKMKSKKIAVKN